MSRPALLSLMCAAPLLLLAACSSCTSSSSGGAAAAPSRDAERAVEGSGARAVRLRVARAELARFSSTLPGTRLMAALARVERTLPPCPRLVAEGTLDDLPGLVEGLRCPSDDGATHEAPAADVLLEDSGSGETIASGDVDARGLLTLSLRAAAQLPPFLVPAGEQPGAPLLGSEDVAFGGQIRARAVALTAPSKTSVLPDLSALVSERALDGRVSFSLLVPDDGSAALPLVLALGVKDRSLVERGVEVALSDMSRRYGVPPVSLTPDDNAPARKRACLGPLRLVEGLSPCVVVEDERVVFSWDPSSLQRALASSPSSFHPERAGFRLHREAAKRAGERLSSARGGAGLQAADALPATLEVVAPSADEASRGVELVVRVGGAS